MKDQHIVPEVYLKGFYEKNKNQFYSLDTSLYYFSKTPHAVPKTAGKVCYKPHYYNLDSEFKEAFPQYATYDELYLEKSFHSYENKLKDIIALFKSRTLVINPEIAKTFLYALYNIKTRNDFFRQSNIESRHSEYVEKVINMSLPTRSDIEKDFHPSVREKAYSIREEKIAELKEKHSVRVAHLMLLIQLETDHDVFVSNFLYYQWHVYKSDHAFLTSDNPGYCLDSKNIVHNTKFTEDFFFTFPLDNCHCLVISDCPLDMTYHEDTTKKNIIYAEAPDKLVEIINEMIIYNANRYVFGSNQKRLNEYSKIFSEKFVKVKPIKSPIVAPSS
jgi:hypothetical protein